MLLEIGWVERATVRNPCSGVRDGIFDGPKAHLLIATYHAVCVITRVCSDRMNVVLLRAEICVRQL